MNLDNIVKYIYGPFKRNRVDGIKAQIDTKLRSDFFTLISIFKQTNGFENVKLYNITENITNESIVINTNNIKTILVEYKNRDHINDKDINDYINRILQLIKNLNFYHKIGFYITLDHQMTNIPSNMNILKELLILFGVNNSKFNSFWNTYIDNFRITIRFGRNQKKNQKRISKKRISKKRISKKRRNKRISKKKLEKGVKSKLKKYI